MKRREALTFDTRGVQSQQIHYFMKKFIMLGASLVMLLVATACMSSAAKMQKNEAGTVKSNEFATVEGLIGIDCPNAVIADAGLVAGEKMNIPTTTLVSSSAKNDEAKNDAEIIAIGEVSTAQSDHMVANDVILENIAATEIKTGYAMEVAGILPDETALVSNSNKYEIQNSNNCNCATCAAMARNTLVNMGGNSA